MISIKCPQCDEPVMLPDAIVTGHARFQNATGECPWCGASMALDEMKPQTPMMILKDETGSIIEPDAWLPVATGNLGLADSADGTAAEDSSTSIDEAGDESSLTIVEDEPWEDSDTIMEEESGLDLRSSDASQFATLADGPENEDDDDGWSTGATIAGATVATGAAVTGAAVAGAATAMGAMATADSPNETDFVAEGETDADSQFQLEPMKVNSDREVQIKTNPAQPAKKSSAWKSAVGAVLGLPIALALLYPVLAWVGNVPDWGFWPYNGQVPAMFGGTSDDSNGRVATPPLSERAMARRNQTKNENISQSVPLTLDGDRESSNGGDASGDTALAGDLGDSTNVLGSTNNKPASTNEPASNGFDLSNPSLGGPTESDLSTPNRDLENNGVDPDRFKLPGSKGPSETSIANDEPAVNDDEPAVNDNASGDGFKLSANSDSNMKNDSNVQNPENALLSSGSDTDEPKASMDSNIDTVAAEIPNESLNQSLDSLDPRVSKVLQMLDSTYDPTKPAPTKKEAVTPFLSICVLAEKEGLEQSDFDPILNRILDNKNALDHVTYLAWPYEKTKAPTGIMFVGKPILDGREIIMARGKTVRWENAPPELADKAVLTIGKMSQRDQAKPLFTAIRTVAIP